MTNDSVKNSPFLLDKEYLLIYGSWAVSACYCGLRKAQHLQKRRHVFLVSESLNTKSVNDGDEIVIHAQPKYIKWKLIHGEPDIFLRKSAKIVYVFDDKSEGLKVLTRILLGD